MFICICDQSILNAPQKPQLGAQWGDHGIGARRESLERRTEPLIRAPLVNRMDLIIKANLFKAMVSQTQ